MKSVIFAIEILRENCRWHHGEECKYTNEQPSLKCQSVRCNENVATTDLLTKFMENCPLMKE